MTKSFVPSTGTGSTFASATTRYCPISGGVNNTGSHSTEANAEFPIRNAGVFQNLYTNVSANTLSFTFSILLRKSGTDTAVTVSYTTGQTGAKEDTSNTATFANTDEAVYRVQSTGGTGSITLQAICSEFVPDTTSDTISFLGRTGSGASSTDSLTAFFHPVEQTSSTTSETSVRWKATRPFTATNFYTYVSANARTTDTSFASRKNGADTAQVLTYTSGQTGAKEDTSNSVSLSEGDFFAFRRTTSTGGGSITLTQISVNAKSTGNYFIMTGGLGTSTGFNFNTTQYVGISGHMLDHGTTEATYTVVPRNTFTIMELATYADTNTIATSPSTITVRDGSSDSALTVSYAAGQTGLKQDSTNQFTVTSATDAICYKVVTPNTSGTLSLNQIGVLGYVPQGYTLTADAAAFTVTGNAVSLNVARTIILTSASFSLTGNAISFVLGKGLIVETATFVVTTGDVAFLITGWTNDSGASSSWTDDTLGYVREARYGFGTYGVSKYGDVRIQNEAVPSASSWTNDTDN